MTTIIKFPTYQDRLRRGFRSIIDEAAKDYDGHVKQSLINDMGAYCDLWAKDDEFIVSLRTEFTQEQVAAMEEGYDSAFEVMRAKAGLLLEELMKLRLKQATCETRHGDNPDPPKAS